MAKRTTLKVGDIVVATCVITDIADGETYIHAVPGTFGVVLEDDFTPEWPVIKWHGPGGLGTCNTRPDTFERYAGRVYSVVG